MPAGDDNAPRADAERVELRNDRDAIDALEQRVLDALERHGYPKASKFAVRLAIEEAVTNAFRHGHKGNPDEPVRIEYEVHPDHVRIAVQDRGSGFTPAAVPDPTLEENLEAPSGRGLMLIRAYMTETRHNEAGNRLEMRYDRPAAGDDG